jgi:hypothetical protein
VAISVAVGQRELREQWRINGGEELAVEREWEEIFD